MAAIFMKIRTNTYVILMGESGCGETSLIKFFGTRRECASSDERLNERLSKDKEKKEMWILLDEVNTSPDIRWFKELICDHSLDGVKINKFDNNTVIYKKYNKDIDALQSFLRKYLANEFIVSLRDVSRCLHFFYWLMQQYEIVLENDNKLSWAGRALNIALGLYYYFRLDDNGKKMYNDVMYQRNKRSFSELLDSEIKSLSESFEISVQVALHNTLKENLFILFFCV
ncbi:hypothetical protein RFI_31929, partial [Reticulomyxa filosa]